MLNNKTLNSINSCNKNIKKCTSTVWTNFNIYNIFDIITLFYIFISSELFWMSLRNIIKIRFFHLSYIPHACFCSLFLLSTFQENVNNRNFKERVSHDCFTRIFFNMSRMRVFSVLDFYVNCDVDVRYKKCNETEFWSQNKSRK